MTHSRNIRYWLVWFAAVGSLATLSGQIVIAQGTRADYERAASLADSTRDKLFRHQVQPEWSADGNSFWYRVQVGPAAYRFYWVDAQRGVRREAFNHERLASAIGSAGNLSCTADSLPFSTLELQANGGQPSEIVFSLGNERWNCNLLTYELKRLDDQVAAERFVVRLNRARRSRGVGQDTSIRFVNRCEEPIRLFWMDRGGQRVAYGELSAGESREQHTFSGHVWVAVDSQDRTHGIFQATDRPGLAIIDAQIVEEIADDSNPDRESRTTNASSPDGKYFAFTRDHNLWLKENATGVERALTADGKAEAAYAGPIQWSPDSSRMVCMLQTPGDQRKVHLIESSPRDQLQPKLHELIYDKPGDNLPLARPRMFAAEDGREVRISEDLMPNPWSLSDIHWAADSKRFTVLYNQRGHQVMRVIAVDAADGSAKAIVDEKSSTFIDYAHKSFLEYLDDTGELVWMSERDGWNHLYLFDSNSGNVKRQITHGEWVVRRVEKIDRKNRQVWFYASGMLADQDPYYEQLCRAPLDGGPLVVLTPGPGNHKVEFSPDGKYLLDQYSRVDLPAVTELRNADTGQLICEIERSDASALLATGWRPPTQFVTTGRDGKTNIYGVIHFPRNVEPHGKYPVIEQIYAGPQDSFVPKRFRSYYDEQALAELGFIVVQIDGMGTSNRSKAFHDVCWKNLGDGGFPDRVLWLKAAAQKYPMMDLSRVGIYGGSAGGQNALRGLLMYPDTYHVGVADCGCHDNRMDKVWWNELWMGWPIGPHYEEQSNATQAHRLQGKLLLTVGELDRNVDPASTMQVVDALIRADKDFELLIIPGSDHGAGEGPYAKRRRQDFFVRHLLKKEPRWDPGSN